MTDLNHVRVEYSAIESQLDTGDVFTFHGDDPLDFMIELGEGGQPYSHAAMVLKYKGELYVWDAPGLGKSFANPFFSLLTPVNSPGCRVAKIRDLMAFYMSGFADQVFYWRKLKSGVSPAQYDQLISFITKVNGMPFPTADIPGLPTEVNLGLGLFRSFAKGTLGEKVEGSYYCAQLTADTYLHMGLIDPNGATNANIPNAYTPADFDSDDPGQLPLTYGTSLGEVVLVHYDLVVDLNPPPISD